MEIDSIMLEVIIFVIYMVAITPIHEIGHMLGYKHYGVKSVIGFKSNIKDKGTVSGYCRTLLWEDNLVFIEDKKKDAVVSFAGAGASIVFCLCMYVIFPLSAFLLVAFWEGMYGCFEITDGWAVNKRITQGMEEVFWYMDSKEEHELFFEELSRSKYEGLMVPQYKMWIRVMGFDLKEFE